jgi:hypothetical protein
MVAQLLSVHARLLDADEATYATVAGLMNAGGTLYADGGIDNKPPIVFWTYALVFKVAGPYNMFAVHTLKIVVVLATAFAIALIAHRLANARAAVVAFVLYGVFTAAGYPAMAAANTEVFMMLPVALTMLTVIASRWWLAGALVAIAAFTKQTAVLDLLVVLVAAAVVPDRHRAVRATVACVSTFAITGVAVLTGLWWQHSAVGFWRWAVLSIPGYGTNAWLANRWALLFQTSVLPWLLVAPLLWVPIALSIVRKRFHGATGDLVLWTWLAVSCVQVVASGQFFGHYFIAVVGPLSVLAAMEIDAWLRPNRISTAVAGVGCLLLSVPAASSIGNNYSDAGALSPGSRQVGEYVKAHTTASDRILVYGNDPTLYIASDRLPSTRMVGFLRGYPRGSINTAGQPPDNWDTAADLWDLLVQDQANHPAALILDAATRGNDFRDYQLAETFPVLAQIVQAHYRRVTVIDGVTIYERMPDNGPSKVGYRQPVGPSNDPE